MPEHRCPRCGKLLVRGDLPRPVEAHCPRCKRKVVLGGTSAKGVD